MTRITQIDLTTSPLNQVRLICVISDISVNQRFRQKSQVGWANVFLVAHRLLLMGFGGQR